MTERISGTVIDIRREDDRQAGYNTVYIIDVGGRAEQAVDYSGAPRQAQVGDQVVVTGRRATNGELELTTIQV